MRILISVLIIFCAVTLRSEEPSRSGRYNGTYCSGTGDVSYLRLIDESFAFFHPNAVVPNLSIIYEPNWDTFVESSGWDAWWIQNSYGFSYSVTPFLQEPWFSILQRSLDMFWNNQGDGQRMGRPGSDGNPRSVMSLVAPAGSLGDAARPTEIIYKQGDGNWAIHDWFYEATAAGVVMQAELLLASRDKNACAHYLPKMELACDFIEKTRNPENNLFLAGPASNLLAPSYGGVKLADGTFGKAYLAGLSVTYLAALDRMVEIYRMTGNPEMVEKYSNRQLITRRSLPLLLTPAGFFVKSIEPGGVKHGVPGQDKFGYLEGVANADAVALRVVDDKTAGSIYRQISGFKEIRPFDFLLTNAPGLDDTYWSWGNASGKGMGGIHEYGCWVNGGVWQTVEGRAILMYYRLGRFEDVYRSATRAMKWAKDFRMDDHFTQWGENTDNLWYDKGSKRHNNGVAICADQFAVPAATLRGLFDYEYLSDRLILRPRIPGTITRYVQKDPVRFGDRKIFLSCDNGGPKVISVRVNGKTLPVSSTEVVSLPYNDLPGIARIEIKTGGGWDSPVPDVPYPDRPWLAGQKKVKGILPDSLLIPYRVLVKMNKFLRNEKGAEYEKSVVNSALEAMNAYQERKNLDAGPGYFRPMTQLKSETIVNLYAKSALGLYVGFKNRMDRYAVQGDATQKHLASLFRDAQKP